MRVVERSRCWPPPPDAVWARVSTFEGVNDELRPLLRMTAPRSVRRLDPADVVLGQRICRSWMLLSGLVPIDYDDLTLVALEPGRGFHERSRMLSIRVWEHERTVDARRRLRVVDRLRLEPRLLGTGALLERIVRCCSAIGTALRRRFG